MSRPHQRSRRACAFKTTRTPHGYRLLQHGVVLSELRCEPGPTHSVFDVLAALATLLELPGRLGLLGFAAGGVLAPIRYLKPTLPVAAIDLDRSSYELFKRHCNSWAGNVEWTEADAADWLAGQPSDFGMLIDDLSVPQDGDVGKPAISFDRLPALIRQRLMAGGIAVSNLLRPQPGTWRRAWSAFTEPFAEVRVVRFTDYENQIVVASDQLPSARRLGRQLRAALTRLGSQQATAIQVANLKTSLSA